MGRIDFDRPQANYFLTDLGLCDLPHVVALFVGRECEQGADKKIENDTEGEKHDRGKEEEKGDEEPSVPV